MTLTQRAERQQVVVVGGGAIGLSSAYHLATRGIDVVAIERGDVGAACSWGNAGWVVPSLVHPFNAPGAVPDALRAMLDPHSPIALRQFPTPQLSLWALRFLRESRPARSERSLRELAGLASTATAEFERLAAELRFELHRDGLLVPFRSEEALESYTDLHRQVEDLGYTGRVQRLDATEVAAKEPSLGAGMAGALHFADEMSVRPGSFTAALADGTTEAGGEIAVQEEVLSITPGRTSRWTVATDRRTLACDAVVVAAGEHSAALLRPTGVRLAMRSGRGCSVTLASEHVTLRQPLKIAEFRVACTPFANGDVRISGTFDLTTRDAPPARGRMQSVLRAAATYLPALGTVDLDAQDIWSGARPCVPDSIPVVGPVGSRPGLFAATGHGTLGITLAPETGRRMADQVGASLPTNTTQGDE